MTTIRLVPGDEIHGAAHPLDESPWNGPVGEVAVCAHLQRAENGEVHLAASDHGERFGRVEEAGPRSDGDGLLAGVDEVGIFVALEGEGAHPQDAVLGLQGHLHVVGDVVGHQGGNADAEVDVVTVAQLAGSDRCHLVAGPSHASAPAVRGRVVRCSMSLTPSGTWTTCVT